MFEALPDEPIKARKAPEPPSAPVGRLGNGEVKHVAGSLPLFQRIHEGASTTLPHIDLAVFLISG
jgi:hypothetical protein